MYKIEVNIGLGLLGEIGVRIGVQINVKTGLDQFLTIKTCFNPIKNQLFKEIGWAASGRPPKGPAAFGRGPRWIPISLNNRFKILLK